MTAPAEPKTDSAAGPSRAPRCSVLDISSRRGTNRCSNEACDPDDSVLMCVAHRVKVLGDLASLPGVSIVLEAQPERPTP